MKYAKQTKQILALLCAVTATVFTAAGSSLRTALRDGTVAVADVLLGGTPEALEALLMKYAVALLVAVLVAGGVWLAWMADLQRRHFFLCCALGCALPFAAGAITSAWTVTLAAVAGGVLAVVCLLAYGWLQKAMPSVFNRETVSYIIFGVLTTVVSFVSQMIFASFGWHVTVNTVGSWVCAVLFAYVVNKLFVFESKTDSAKAFWRELGLFFGARVASLGMELVFMFVTVELLDFSEAVCKLIAQVFILVANYIFSKLIIFRKKDENA